MTSFRRPHTNDYTVGWICALPIELAAAAELLDGEFEDLPEGTNDTNLYTFGRVGDKVVVACLPAGQTGTNPAAAVANQMKSRFTLIRFALMIGVGGGVPSAGSDIRLGGVVISQPYMQHGGVVQYDFGKTGAGGQFTRTGSLNTPPTALLNALAKLQSNRYRGRSSLPTHLLVFNRLSQFSREKAGPNILFKLTYNYTRGAIYKEYSRKILVERALYITKEVIIYYGIIASSN
jgi:ankyrin repeat domain-containing protein 50